MRTVDSTILTVGFFAMILAVAVSLAAVPAVVAAEGEDPPGALTAGAAKCSIVPPFPTHMGGFHDRKETFKGVSTPIYARALVCDNGQTRLTVVTMDVCYILGDMVDVIRKMVEEQVGIPGENVMICATHSHSGPSEFPLGSLDERQRLQEFLVTQIVKAITQASGNLQPAKLGFAYGELQGITRNRQQKNLTVVDPQVGVLRVQEANSREIIATLINFTGHPVIVGGKNLLLSSEYPGQAQQTVEDVLGGVAMFTQGACGDVTMQRSGPELEEVKRIGHVVAGEVIKTAETIRVSNEATLLSKLQSVELVVRDHPSVSDTEAALAAAQKALAEAKAAFAPAEQLSRLKKAEDDAAMNVQLAAYLEQRTSAHGIEDRGCTHVMQIGPLVIVGIPGELFVEFALEMKQRTRQEKDRPLIVAGYANDYLGYIITPRAEYTGGYEQAVSLVNEHAGRALTEASMRLVNEFVK
jgi:neutral/alkaline ceramidase-like enzyme